jgi:hypothetical protein
MSRASDIIVLCEDHLQEVFVRRFLKRGWRIKQPPIRVVLYPHGGSGGAGEQHVRDNYPNQLKACRTRHAGTILIVVMDADAGTVQEHHRELDRACGCAQPPVNPRQANEAVVHVIPKWHIETWLAYLDDVSVSEDCQYRSDYGFRGCESKCHQFVDRLATACKNGEQLANMPNSLIGACSEFERIRGLL